MDGEAESTRGRPRTYDRRRILQVGVGITATAVAGCFGGSEEGDEPAPEAVTLPDDATCDVCGMVISQHPGPTAEIFYADHSPEGHDNPARFDSTWEAYKYDFERENRGWKRSVSSAARR